MDQPALLILGGYGNTGYPLARLLMQESQVSLVLAGRSLEKAQAAANELNQVFPGERVSALRLDAANQAEMVNVFKGMTMVVVASSTSLYTRQVAEAALQAGIDYLDVQFSSEKMAILREFKDQIVQGGRCFITEGGFHPGLPAALVRYAASQMDELYKANVGSVIKMDWKPLVLSQATLDELLVELNGFKSKIFQDGQWRNASLTSTRDMLRMDFGREFGKQFTFPMYLEEMGELPQVNPSLRETGFYVGGFNWFVDWIAMPVALVALRISPRGMLKPMGRLTRWGLDTFSKPPYGVMLRLEAEGLKNGGKRELKVNLYHPDGYMFTAIPVAACLLQYLDGTIKKPGLWTQANLVEPGRMMKDMQKMGVEMVEEGRVP
jgi:saccharopine dehydrogenase-like NADP-dependent oxidoreductase